MEARFGNIRWVSDAGHSWLQVPRKLVKKAMNISQFSYMTATSVFLECDDDAPKFFVFYKLPFDGDDAQGFNSRGVDYDGEAPCRSAESYRF